MKNLKSTLGCRIREERTKWSIEKLSEVIDISPSFLASVERGEKSLIDFTFICSTMA